MPGMSQLQKFTTEYIATKDRIRISGQSEQGGIPPFSLLPDLRANQSLILITEVTHAMLQKAEKEETCPRITWMHTD